MRHLFADTFYWVALFSPRDRWHRQALDISRILGEHHLWTTDEVLTEFLAICSATGPRLRQRAVNLVRRMLTDPGITVLPQTHASFLEGLMLYEQRSDKQYSLTDCISMNAMRQNNIIEVLTHDRHFEQEGFQPLFR
jgi:predicted nucleic acid-binding protein